jgi:hypothetical protein
MAILFAMVFSAALGLVAGSCLSVLWLLVFWPIVFISVFLVARFEGTSIGSTIGLAVAAIVALQGCYLVGGFLRPRNRVWVSGRRTKA